MPNTLYYGDNLDILRRRLRDETVDPCSIDPPFNSMSVYPHSRRKPVTRLNFGE